MTPDEGHPWNSSTRERQADRYAHPNSLYAKAKNDPALGTGQRDQLERILDGMREADADLKAMETWARNGFVS